jgi:diacylglycerol kinase (ATP)
VPTTVALLVNPTAGRGRGARLAGPVAARLRALGLRVDVVAGTDAADGLARARARVAAGVDALVALGGDGLVHLALQAVAGTPTPLGVVPAGTGNDFARMLGVPLADPMAAVEVVAAGRHRAVDAGRTGDRWFAGVLGAGFDSVVTERANRMRWPTGRARYDVAVLAELRTFRPVPFVLELDGRACHTEAMLVAVGNGPSYGGGMRICPGADPADGLLDVTVLGPVGRAELLRVLPRVYSGGHVGHPAVTVHRARRVSLAAPGVVAYADGERIGPLPVTCEVVPAALRVLAPGAAAAAP